MGENSLTRFTVLFQATVWQKARVSDHRAALMAVLGAASAANLLPVQHRQEQPEVSGALSKHGPGYGFQRERWGSSARLAREIRSSKIGMGLGGGSGGDYLVHYLFPSSLYFLNP